jgi:predicted ATP-grasp superfamily ATP-dependent carboligase
VTSKLRVLIADGEQRAALAIVRSLGRAGHHVEVASSCARPLAGASRHASARHRIADPLAAPDAFVDDVRRLSRERRIDVVLPVTDASLLALSSQRGELGDVALPWPGAEQVRAVADKAVVADVARELGIPVPATRLVGSPDEALTAAAELRFPIVVKPSRSVREGSDGQPIKLAVTHAASPEDLRSRVSKLQAAAFPLLLQERVVGPGIGVSCLMWGGRLAAHFTHRRLRERPPSGGVSVYAESIAPDATLVERSAALLRHFHWQGVAMVEYKLDRATGDAYLMEVNGRFWGSLQLAIDAGVDFPALLLALSDGTAPAADPPAYRTGVRFRWWWGDVDHLLVRLMRSPARLALPPDAPSRFDVVRSFAAAGWPRHDSDSLRRDDPRPFLVDTLDWIRGHLGMAAPSARPPSLPSAAAPSGASTAASPAA